MNLSSLRPPAGSTKKRKRVGRGPGSGHGKTSGRGEKGQKSRSGHSQRLGFEGGQMPLIRRVPKRGFHNEFRVEYAVVNLSQLGGLGTAVTPDLLVERGLAHRDRRIKVLGNGDAPAAVTVSAHKFSRTAREKIEAAGGRCEELA